MRTSDARTPSLDSDRVRAARVTRWLLLPAAVVLCAAAPAATPLLHTHPLVSFALSPDGALLATGAQGGDDADAADEGVVLWDVATGKARWRTKLPGGVGHADQLRHGLAFSANGTRLAASAHTNGVFVLDTATGAQRSQHHLTGDDGAPQHVWSPDGGELFIDSADGPRTEGVTTGAVVSADLDSPRDRPQWLTAPVHHAFDLVALDARALVLLSEGTLLAVPRPSGPAKPLGTVTNSPQRAVAVSRAGLVAAGTEGGEVAVFDPVTRSHVTHQQGAPVEALTFGQGAQLCVVHQANKHTPTHASVPGKLVTITFPPTLAAVDWLAFADGQPCAPSPDGTEVLLVLPDGAVERWKAAEPPVRVQRLATIPSANAVLWASPTRAIVLGRTVLAFLELPSGRVLSQTTFPSR